MADWVVEARAEQPGLTPLPLDEIEAVVRWTLAAEDARDAEISVALVADGTISGLNRRYLSRDGPTDVISFPLEQPGVPLVGDVYIGVQQAERQAADLGVPLREELLRLAVHGTLHLLGYEHSEGDEHPEEYGQEYGRPEGPGGDASAIFRRQEEILAAFLDRS